MQRKRPILMAAVVLLWTLSAVPVQADYEVLSGDYATHDPVIMRQGDTYYVFCTGTRIPIRASTDMHHWWSVGHMLAAIPSWVYTVVPKYTGSSVWAPDISYFDGQYHLYYSVSTFGSNVSAIGLATNTTLDPCDPEYEWVDSGGPVVRSRSSDNYNTIDPALFIDHRDATVRYWLAFGSFWSGIKMTEVNPATGCPLSNPPVLSSLAWNKSIEAPFLISRNGYYYLFVSFDTCCQGVRSTYNVRVGRATEVTGPYTDKDGVSMMASGGTRLTWNDERWKGPGHEAVFLDRDGRYWLVHHAYDAQRNGRSYLRIHELFWTPDDWPTLVAQGPVDVNEALVAWWNLDEGFGDIAADSSGNGYDGDIIGATWVTDDPNHRVAIAFDGADDYINLPDGFSDFDGLTVSLWVFPTSVREWAGFIDLGNGDSDNNLFLGYSRSTLIFGIVNGTANLGTLTAANAIDLDTWQHFAATVDVCGEAALYKNGTRIKTGTTSPPWNVTRTDNHIARSNWSADACYRGLLDDIRIYNRTLDVNDINDIYVQGDRIEPLTQ
ncbi:MAG: family 43 glycosylhydrolase [Sedimentisphaerales bacterium]|nr:family 43 glycosylhydrolase [Sedimentisphaerales bacterium]